MAFNFTFQAVALQWSDKTCFLTTLTTSVSWVFYHTDIFRKRITQSKTSYQDQSPSCTTESRICSQHWDQNIGTKAATFTSSLPARLTGYSDVVT